MGQINPDSHLDNVVDGSVQEIVKSFAGDGLGGKINGFVDKLF